MWSSLYANNMKNSTTVDSHGLMCILMVFILLFIIDIIFIIYTFHCLIECVHNNVISVPVAILLGLLVFTPGAGFFVAISVIVYHSVYCKHRDTTPKFEFY